VLVLELLGCMLFQRYDQHRWWLVRALLGRKIDAVIRHSTLVVVGNEYLAQRARDAGAKSIKIMPTVVDGELFLVMRWFINLVEVNGKH